MSHLPLALAAYCLKSVHRYNNGVKIREFIWPEERIEHIARHGVTPEEVEEACFGQALVQRAKSVCVVIRFPGAVGYPVTARPMTDKEKRRYQQWQR